MIIITKLLVLVVKTQKSTYLSIKAWSSWTLINNWAHFQRDFNGPFIEDQSRPYPYLDYYFFIPLFLLLKWYQIINFLHILLFLVHSKNSEWINLGENSRKSIIDTTTVLTFFSLFPLIWHSIHELFFVPFLLSRLLFIGYSFNHSRRVCYISIHFYGFD